MVICEFGEGRFVKTYFQHAATYTPISPHSKLGPNQTQGLLLAPTKFPTVVHPRFWDCHTSNVAHPQKQFASVIFA